MAYFKRPPKDSRYPAGNNYWRLDKDYENREAIIKAGYGGAKFGFPKVFFAERIQRRELCYHTCSKQELVRFVSERGLIFPSKKRTRNDYLNLLYSTDEKRPAFDFVGLPPELREMVYDYYVARINEDNKNGILNPTSPPLARVNKLLRKEVSPLFFSGVQVALQFSHRTMVRGEGSDGLQWTQETRQFLQRTQKDNLESIRHVALHAPVSDKSKIHWKQPILCEMLIIPAAMSYMVDMGLFTMVCGPDFVDGLDVSYERTDWADNYLGDVLEQVLVRASWRDKFHLKRSDFEAFRRVFEKNLRNYDKHFE